MKAETSLQFETGGVVYGWTGEYRIPTFEDHGQVYRVDVPPEMIFESQDGVRIGVHPQRVLEDEKKGKELDKRINRFVRRENERGIPFDPSLLIAGDWKPTPEDPKPLPKPPTPCPQSEWERDLIETEIEMFGRR